MSRRAGATTRCPFPHQRPATRAKANDSYGLCKSHLTASLPVKLTFQCQTCFTAKGTAMKRTLVILLLAVAGLIATATVVDAVRNDTLTPVWEMAWLPAVLAGVLYPRSGRCRRAS